MNQSPSISSRDELEFVAADWIARRNGPDFTPVHQAELSRWLANPVHAAAYAAMESSWRSLGQLRRTGQAEAVERKLESRERQRSQWRKLFACASGLAAAAALAFAFLYQPNPAVSTATVALRPDRQTLPDGSIVELNAGAEITTAFTPEVRNVTLVRGEALFEVTKNKARPFVVTAGGVQVRAVGTAFTVRMDPKRVDVLVTEGRVEVKHEATATIDPASPSTPASFVPVFVDAGGRVSVPTELPEAMAPSVQPVTQVQVAEALSWRDKRVEFTETPLPEAVRLFNQANRRQLTLADPSLQQRSITGIVWADDPEGFARILETSFSLKADIKETGEIVLHDARAGR